MTGNRELEPIEIIQVLRPPNWGQPLVRYGEHEQAAKTFERAIAILEKTVEPHHAGLLANVANLGSVYYTLDEYERSIELLERAFEGLVETVGMQHGTVASVLTALGSARVMSGSCPEGIEDLERALDIRTALNVPPRLTAESRMALAQAFWDCPVAEGRNRPLARSLAEEASSLLADSPSGSADWRKRVATWLAEHHT